MKNCETFKTVKQCADKSGDPAQIAQCVGAGALCPNKQYYLSCVTKNQRDFRAATVCGLAQGLTPEQQIALACAVSTGGVPSAFAACAGSQLLERELDKCWNQGIGGDGCFGNNNDMWKLLDAVDAQFGALYVVEEALLFLAEQDRSSGGERAVPT